jgi:UDP-glucose 4-epimerase
MLQRLGRQLGAGALYGDGVRLLRFGRGLDNRRLREELGYQPRFDAAEAVRDLAGKLAGRRMGPELHPGALAARLIGAAR